MSRKTSDNLSTIYQIRFSGVEKYRNDVGRRLVNEFFVKWIPKGSAALDLECGYGEFINNVSDWDFRNFPEMSWPL
jgi:hypothetical protein